MSYVRPISIFLVAAISLTINSARAQSVDAPVLTAGLKWDYQTTDMWSNKLILRQSTRVIGVAGDYARMSYESTPVGAKFELTKPTTSEGTVRADLNSSATYRGEKMDKIWYKWPLELGKKWNYVVKTDLAPVGTSTQPQVMTSNFAAEVKSFESIEVPAGKFKAIKIVYKGNWSTENPAASGTSVSTSWYSPEAKNFVQYTYEAFGADGVPQTRTIQQLVLLHTDDK